MDKFEIWSSIAEKSTLNGELWSVFNFASLVLSKDELTRLYSKSAYHFYYFPVKVDMNFNLCV